MKVLHVIGGGEFGGAEKHILTLFRAFDPREVQMEVVCLFPAPFAELAREAGMRVEVLPMASKFDLRVVRRLRQLLTKGGYDLLHTHGVRANFLGRLAAWPWPGPVVTTVHSRLAQDYPHWWDRKINLLIEKWTSSRTDHFIAVSRFLAESLVQEGIARDKITVVYNGIELPLPSSSSGKSFRATWGVPPDVPLVATVGRLHPVKGHRYFLEAAAEVRRELPEARFAVIGTGPERRELEELAYRLGIEDSVIFTGFLPEVTSCYPEFDLLVLASLMEGFGLVVLEALALGTPVVATRVGGVPEVVREGETGLLVPPADAQALARAIIWMLEHRDRAQEMAARGKEMVAREFSSTRMAKDTLEVYRRVLRERRRRIGQA
ncbi:glycosyl transferase group 1 [Ammonifex degensii KC4]|uniref:Glycosyl transferase group 1 n=1 Tax=Ammonifex degensii (strain DSM 10501 / KC4) TaxID=429009 RepID=C9RAK3_AMMDK|nr:glycosyltransferase [Ammonifex degensii]ACX51280.1 glycosyl transferase group 1 [Ammonifex degensii KC4]